MNKIIKVLIIKNKKEIKLTFKYTIRQFYLVLIYYIISNILFKFLILNFYIILNRKVYKKD